jgi:CxxC motif-containing protein
VEALLKDGEIVSVSGASCPKGDAYVRQEITYPRRTIASSVLVRGGTLPLVSVRLDRPVPKNRLFDVMKEIRKTELNAPVKSGTCVIEKYLAEQRRDRTKTVPLAAEQPTSRQYK